jgi:hypothetical protein
MAKDKFEKTVIHLTIKATNEHSYYGSIACIYDHYTNEEIGIRYSSLRSFGVSEDKPYENKKVVIRKGKLLTKNRIKVKDETKLD